MSVPNVLLLTGIPPGSSSSGGVFLHDLCLLYPRQHLSCFCISPTPEFSDVSDDLQWLSYRYANMPLDFGVEGWGAAVRKTSGLLRRYRAWADTDLLSQVVQFGQQHRVDVLWVVLNTAYLVHIAQKVAAALGAELVVTVWDVIESKLPAKYYDRLSKMWVIRTFQWVMQATVRCGVMSEGMAQLYQQRYDVNPVIMRHGIQPDLVQEPGRTPPEADTFKIGFAGNPYTKAEWEALLAALDKNNWQIQGRPVRLVLLGNRFSFLERRPIPADYMGWCSLAETIQILHDVDVTYLPYWFDAQHREQATSSFPSKLTAYLAAARPVFFHGPAYASVPLFFQEHPVGLCCHSRAPDDIYRTLEQFARDTDAYHQMVAAARTAAQTELSLMTFRQRFAQLIGLPVEHLLPINQSDAV